MLASACSTRSQQSTAGQAAGRGIAWNALIRRGIYFPIARHRGAAEGRNGRAGLRVKGFADTVPGFRDSAEHSGASGGTVILLKPTDKMRDIFSDRASMRCGGGAEWAGWLGKQGQSEMLGWARAPAHEIGNCVYCPRIRIATELVLSRCGTHREWKNRVDRSGDIADDAHGISSNLSIRARARIPAKGKPVSNARGGWVVDGLRHTDRPRLP